MQFDEEEKQENVTMHAPAAQKPKQKAKNTTVIATTPTNISTSFKFWQSKLRYKGTIWLPWSALSVQWCHFCELFKKISSIPHFSRQAKTKNFERGDFAKARLRKANDGDDGQTNLLSIHFLFFCTNQVWKERIFFGTDDTYHLRK